MTMRIALILFFVSLILCLDLNAQFNRVTVNEENIPGSGVTKPAGENEFVSLIDGELYHITYDETNQFRIKWLDNTLIDLFDFELYDIDLDGDKDIICYQWTKGNFRIYLKEEGQFVFQPDRIIGAAKPHFLHPQDFDGDGKEDLLVNHNVYQVNNPFELERILRYPNITTYYYKYCRFFDYDNDGDKDIFFHQVNRLWVLVNKGVEVTNTSLKINETNERTSWSRIINTTDGPKILYYDKSTDYIRQLTFIDSANYEIHNVVHSSTQLDNAEPEVLDLDMDGNEELVIRNPGNNKVLVFKYNTEDQTGKLYDTGTTLPQVLSYGYMEYNDSPALFVGSDNAFHLYRFDTDTTLEKIVTQVNAIDGSDFSFRDFDGDGNTDIVTGTNIKQILWRRDLWQY